MEISFWEVVLKIIDFIRTFGFKAFLIVVGLAIVLAFLNMVFGSNKPGVEKSQPRQPDRNTGSNNNNRSQPKEMPVKFVKTYEVKAKPNSQKALPQKKEYAAPRSDQKLLNG